MFLCAGLALSQMTDRTELYSMEEKHAPTIALQKEPVYLHLSDHYYPLHTQEATALSCPSKRRFGKYVAIQGVL